MLYLKPLNAEDGEKEYAFFQTLPPENGFMNPFYGISYDAFLARLPEYLAYARGENLSPGRVAATTALLWEEDEIVGMFSLRHYLNEALRAGAGHIGCAIRPDLRGRGYAKEGLKLAVEYLRGLPDFDGEEIHLSCNKDNTPSLKTMLACGGYIHHTGPGRYFVRIP